jgi:ligand-binding SRPBCC domain-containing protein
VAHQENRTMKTLKRTQFLPISLDEAWEFFSTPKNLNEITPPNMTFTITSELPEKMYEGLMITYRITPILNIPIEWCTEITKIKDHQYFIDEQRKGPYRIWHHEHHFKEVENGIIMTDILYYEIGFSFLGTLAGRLFVDKKIASIFDYRHQILADRFF